jgi:hypothetical protein
LDRHHHHHRRRHRRSPDQKAFLGPCKILPVLALGQKMDSSQKEILSAIADHSSTVEKRLDALESAVARLDERTKLTA